MSAIGGRVMRLLVALFATAVCCSAHAAEFTRSDSKDGKTRVDLVGEIMPGDADKLRAIISSTNDTKRIVVTIRLNSPGGNLLEGVALSEIIKFGRISTSVLGEKTCASACFIAFAAGYEKFANYTARIGVHGVSDAKGEEVGDATVTMSRILKTLGVSSSILGKLVVTPPQEIMWLTTDDLRSMNVTMFGKPQQIPPIAQTPAPDSQVPPPRQISPTDGANAPVPSWDDLVKRALVASSEQNGGKPRVNRVCQPEYKLCTIAIFYANKEKTDVMLRTAENAAGKIIRRDMCSFNAFDDIRTCLNWESGKVTKEMKNLKGEWILVED